MPVPDLYLICIPICISPICTPRKSVPKKLYKLRGIHFVTVPKKTSPKKYQKNHSVPVLNLCVTVPNPPNAPCLFFPIPLTYLKHGWIFPSTRLRILRIHSRLPRSTF